MKKIGGILKNNFKYLLLLTILLTAQVILDIKITKYNYNIIEIGIVNNGIVDNIPHAIRRDKMIEIFRYVSNEDKQDILNNYSFISSPYEKYVEQYPILKEEFIYILNEDYSNHISKYFVNPIIIMNIDQDEKSVVKLRDKFEIPDELKVSEFYRKQYEDTKKDMIKYIKNNLYDLDDDTTLRNFVKNEYQAMKVDLDNLQKDYIKVELIYLVIFIIVSLIMALIIIKITNKLLELIGHKYSYMIKYGIYSLLLFIISSCCLASFNHIKKWVILSFGLFIVIQLVLSLIYLLFSKSIIKLIEKYKKYIVKYLLTLITFINIAINGITLITILFGSREFFIDKLKINYRGIKVIYSLQLTISLLILFGIMIMIIRMKDNNLLKKKIDEDKKKNKTKNKDKDINTIDKREVVKNKDTKNTKNSGNKSNAVKKNNSSTPKKKSTNKKTKGKSNGSKKKTNKKSNKK